MSFNDTQDARVEKIMALLAKTEERGCTSEEAEAAFAAAQRLMTKWAIDTAILDAVNGKKVDEKIVTDRSVHVSGGYIIQLGYLWQTAARANDCEMLWQKYGSKATVILVGYESDVERVKLLGTSLQLQVLREARSAKPTLSDWDGRSRGMQAYVFRRSFIDGWVAQVGRRLQEARTAAVEEREAETGTSLLPALLDRSQSVKQYVQETMRTSKARATRQSYSANGAAAGRAAGSRADIGQHRVGGSHRALGR